MTRSTLLRATTTFTATVSFAAMVAYPMNAVQAAPLKQWLASPDTWSWVPELLQHVLC